MTTILIYFLAINLIGFLAIWHDKNQAVRHRYRISEKTLLAIVAIGGVLGSGFSMLLFRHKTSKASYLLKFFGIVLFQLLLIVLFFKDFWQQYV
jgi:uncharacterized membrane protein YsdA (DUF1294 family)